MKKFEKYARQQFRILRKHIKNTSESTDPEIYHKIRVDVKRIKVILSVIEEQYNDFNAHKAYKPFRDIFRQAGLIREMEVNKEIAKQYHVGGGEAEDAPYENHESIESFTARVDEFLASIKKEKEELIPVLDKIEKGTLKLYVTKQKLNIKSQLFPSPFMESLHKTRKAIKEVIYLAEISENTTGHELKFFKKMEEAIGRLHDKEVLLASLSEEEDLVMSAQREVITQECLKERNEIFRLATKFYTV